MKPPGSPEAFAYPAHRGGERVDPELVEHDACALVAVARKDGQPTRDLLDLALHGLVCLHHRSGTVDGEGDGAGVLTDIPRAVWADRVGDRAFDAHFAVAHLFVPPEGDEIEEQSVRRILQRHGLRILAESHSGLDPSVLGPRGRAGAPRFWQIALYVPGSRKAGAASLHETWSDIEVSSAATVVSLSRRSVVYKLRGDATQLPRAYADLADPRFATSLAFGHNRYATNTTTSFERVQPFASIAHNGEINTVERLRVEARMLRLQLSRNGSDSQDVDAIVRGMVNKLGLSLVEAMELLFPPIVNEIKRMDARAQDAYMHARAAFGPFAQGPAAILSRVGDTCVFSVDALGLRPLWHVETPDEHVFASERGFVPLTRYASDPRPLGPGEHVALRRDASGWRFLDADALRERFLASRRERGVKAEGLHAHLETGGPAEAPAPPPKRNGRGMARWEIGLPPDEFEDIALRREQQFAAFGWEPDDVRMAKAMAETAGEPIGSLGYDGPLGILSERTANLADHLHETVAVVTNPAIDREREIEHFSTRTLLGPRPSPRGHAPARPWIELRQPLLLGGHAAETGVRGADHRGTARKLGTWILEDVVTEFDRHYPRGPVMLSSDRDWEEHPRDALARIAAAACRGIRRGARLIVVQDRGVMSEGRAWIDPILTVAAVHRALVEQPSGSGSLRRDCAILVSGGSFRNLHDIVVALGVGADAVNPYLLLEHALSLEDPDALPNLVEALRKGIEKVISTLGIHELRGYGRLVSAIGVAPDVARILGIRTFCASEETGLGWQRIAEDGLERAAMLRERTPARLAVPFRIYPRVWKAALQVASGEAPYRAYAEKLVEHERAHPVSLRHLWDLRGMDESPVASDDAPRADTSSGEHAMPFYISSMSFGSQGETAYRAYAEAAFRMNMLCVNGEGGELPDLLGRYPRNRGQQIASGRFGVSALLANSSNYLEIKIGQGAKPGEGGHLPGRKVSEKVALARNARPGVDLISPSNNHDIYSIEDLAQVVHELKTVNPRAKVAVKIPVTPEVGIIAVGIAKSGADIVTLSGYDGGTGAARQHALRRAGLPVEIGVSEAHRALVAAGLRDRVEVWCDGGVKSAHDVAKLMCLGADRCGFATLAMVSIGCTICRGCQLDTCHVGIATQIESVAEATARGIKKFEPQELERAVENLQRSFSALREELAKIAGQLGVERTADLVGRSDLLVQARGVERVDLSSLTTGVTPSRREREAERVEAVAVATATGAETSTTVRMLDARDRFVGTPRSGEMARARIFGGETPELRITFGGGSVAGNGAAAYATEGLAITINGGVQDGAAKTALGGKVAILKAPNAAGRHVDGSVGKCFAYGAQRGRFLVQGSADARAGIRLSGADVVIGGDVKGFAFEYMTWGRAVILGDVGRWICSGMSGGMVFVRHDPSRGLDEAGLRDRLAKGAKVSIRQLTDEDQKALEELLGAYAEALAGSGQTEEAQAVRTLLWTPDAFRVIKPGGEIVDQTISTE
ncbi:MAG: alpha-hydroxy-acid oxidizing protein [Chloroflexota bacterium]|nr:alpha-hydroxy-acid oxidizing protein [Chloroflexota bacterium]